MEKWELLHTNKEGVTDCSYLEIHKEGRYFSGYLNGYKHFSGFSSKEDSYKALLSILRYQVNFDNQ